ncbi:hypothetical protein TUMSATVNIG1_53130 [Vibrio nigripulchritudo]|uniref:hypothetical protein n=1 Tax=Vibrio nigripulchritudo TaxID=28173 RepID=UPI00190E20C1|nr:hypothetical protein [Vibrio nigripulchritudo]BCL73338.1 hypothetical protein VNTUMSATTG_52750 [Vibrio nigripulchritudo]BDU34704.1 hypothetical protein TUMSATVNIG1_53130 [Vibrio nigripulchritudo]
MEHFRDITGFQAVGRVLRKEAKSRNDVIDYMSFLSQLVFCDKVKVTFQGPEEITRGTIETRKLLISCGVPEKFLEEYKYSRGKDQEVERKKIANKIYNDWIDNGFPILDEIGDTAFPAYYYSMLEETVKIFQDVFIENHKTREYGEPSDYKHEILQSINDDKISYLVGLLLCDDDLVSLIRFNFRENKPSKKQIYDFISKTRNKLNLYLSANSNLIFTPSYSRSSTNYLMNRNLKIQVYSMDNPEQEFRNLDIDQNNFESRIPSAMEMLLFEFGDDPREMLDKTLTLRNILSYYREGTLDKFNSIKFSGTDIEKINYEQELSYAYNYVKKELVSQTKNANNNKNMEFGKFSYCFTDYSLNDNTIASGLFNKLYKSFKKSTNSSRVVNMLTQELVALIHHSDSSYLNRVDELFAKVKLK